MKVTIYHILTIFLLILVTNCPGKLEQNFLKQKYSIDKLQNLGRLKINLITSDNFEYPNLTIILTKSKPELLTINGEYYEPYSLSPIPLIIPVAVLKEIYPVISNEDRLVITQKLTKSTPIIIELPEGNYFASIFNSGNNFPTSFQKGLNAVTLGLFGYNVNKQDKKSYDTIYLDKLEIDFPNINHGHCKYDTISNNDFFLTAGKNKSICPKIHIFKNVETSINLKVSQGITDGDGTTRKWIIGIFVLHPFLYGLTTEIRDYQFEHNLK